MDEKFIAVLRWAARFLSLIPIGILIADLFLPHMTEISLLSTDQWLSLILVILSVGGLAIAWRWEGFGGILSLISLSLLLKNKTTIWQLFGCKSIGLFLDVRSIIAVVKFMQIGHLLEIMAGNHCFGS